MFNVDTSVSMRQWITDRATLVNEFANFEQLFVEFWDGVEYRLRREDEGLGPAAAEVTQSVNDAFFNLLRPCADTTTQVAPEIRLSERALELEPAFMMSASPSAAVLAAEETWHHYFASPAVSRSISRQRGALSSPGPALVAVEVSRPFLRAYLPVACVLTTRPWTFTEQGAIPVATRGSLAKLVARLFGKS